MDIALNDQKTNNKLENSHEIKDAEIDNSMLAYSCVEMEIMKVLHNELPGTPANFFELLFLSDCRMSEGIGIK